MCRGVVECLVGFVRPMDPTAIDDHHDLFASFLAGRHHWVDISAPLLGIKVRHDFIEDFGGAIVDGADDAEPHTTRDTAPGAITSPGLAFEAFFTSLLLDSGVLGSRVVQEAQLVFKTIEK
jgi:hypothetical protein